MVEKRFLLWFDGEIIVLSWKELAGLRFLAFAQRISSEDADEPIHFALPIFLMREQRMALQRKRT
jgi:hypothetical protein